MVAPLARWHRRINDLPFDWVRRLDLAARQPVGEPCVVLRPHSAQFGVLMPRFEFFLEVSRERLFVPMSQSTGNTWMTKTDLRQ